MGVESDNKDRYGETYSHTHTHTPTHAHTHTRTHPHTWRDDEATKFDDLGLSAIRDSRIISPSAKLDVLGLVCYNQASLVCIPPMTKKLSELE